MSQTSTPGCGRVAVAEVHVGGALEHGGDDHKRHPANAEHAFTHTTTTSALRLTSALDFDSEPNFSRCRVVIATPRCAGGRRRAGEASTTPSYVAPGLESSFLLLFVAVVISFPASAMSTPRRRGDHNAPRITLLGLCGFEDPQDTLAEVSFTWRPDNG
ncbi:hypothetical protein BDZ89DRAFT_1136071 [Hymenopellis radicata]|nr:hypothetical protein BDZ89DRAFT_1136071 [Hymenopellis radicata]